MSRYLYRLFDGDGALLYVGITNQPRSRFWGHAASSPWWSEVASKTVEDFGDGSASAAEQRAIFWEAPKYNIRHQATDQDRAESLEVARYVAERHDRERNRLADRTTPTVFYDPDYGLALFHGVGFTQVVMPEIKARAVATVLGVPFEIRREIVAA